MTEQLPNALLFLIVRASAWNDLVCCWSQPVHVFIKCKQIFNNEGKKGYGTCNYINAHQKFNNKGIPHKNITVVAFYHSFSLKWNRLSCSSCWPFAKMTILAASYIDVFKNFQSNLSQSLKREPFI